MEHDFVIVVIASWGFWNYSCSCHKLGKGYRSEEYARAAARRHVKAMTSKAKECK